MLRSGFLVFMNGALVFADKNLYDPPERRKTPDVRLSLEKGSLLLPLKAGDNGGCRGSGKRFLRLGHQMRFDDVKNLLQEGH